MSIKRYLPRPVLAIARGLRDANRRHRRARLRPLSEVRLLEVLHETLRVRVGDIVFVHSSLDALKLSFSWLRLLPILREMVGSSGTLIFPTYPQLGSFEFLRQGLTFDVRSTPSFMGALTEIARRTPGAVRSLHPTKSVCAIGPAAETLCSEHHYSPYPYDLNSPYFKFVQLGGKAIGLGVSTARLSFTHAVDDRLKDRFPVRVYHNQLFIAPCIDQSGEAVHVKTYAHNMALMRHDVPRFVRRYLAAHICQDLSIEGTPFFRAEARPMFDQMLTLASRNITMYPRRVYAKGA